MQYKADRLFKIILTFFFLDNTVEETAAINSVKSMLTNITFDPVSDQPKEFNFTHPIAWSYM